MVSTTLNDIQVSVAAIADQSTTPPTAGGSESELRKSFINRSIEEFSHAYDWEVLRKTLWVSVTGVSQGSLTMPMNFRKMARMPLYYSSGVEGGEEWSEIIPEEIGMHQSTDKYFYMLGDRGNGRTMIWNPATIASGASLMITYFAFPTSLTSPADVVFLDNPEFLVNRTIAYIFEARSDSRYQAYEVRARENILSQIDNQNDTSRAFGENDNVKTREEKYWGFRVGRD